MSNEQSAESVRCRHGSGPFKGRDWKCRLGFHFWLPYPYHPCCQICGKGRHNDG